MIATTRILEDELAHFELDDSNDKVGNESNFHHLHRLHRQSFIELIGPLVKAHQHYFIEPVRDNHRHG